MNVLGMVVDFGISISGVRTLKKNNLNLTLDEFICSSFLLKFFVFFLVSICYLVFFTYTATEEEMFFIVTLLGVFITGMDSLWILQVSGDLYKIKTFKEITKLERNGLFVYESVPGTAVTDLNVFDDGMTFKVEGPEDAQITVEMEAETEYKVLLDGVNVGHMTTNLGGKLSFSVELEKAEDVAVEIVKA